MSLVGLQTFDMTEGAILPKILRFSLPLAATGMLQLLFNAADIVVVGISAGSLSLAAVGATASLINLLMGAFMGISVGVNILIARQIGGCRGDFVQRAVHSAFALGVLLGAAVCIAGVLLSTPLLRWMGTPAEVLPLSALYLRIYFFGAPATLVYQFGTAVLRAFGDTKRPLAYLTASGILNLTLNLCFVIVWKLGVAGVAMATAISQYVALFCVVRCLMKAEGCGHLELRRIRLHRQEALQILQIGFPAGLQTVIFNIANVVIQGSVNSFGAVVIAANTAAANVDSFLHIAMNAVFHASMTFTSQNLGAKRIHQVPKIFFSCFLAVWIIGAPLCALTGLFAPQLLGIYVSRADPSYEAVLAYGLVRIRHITVLYVLSGIMEVCCGMVRGLGRSWLPMFISTFGACGLRITWVATVFRTDHTLSTLYDCFPVSFALTAALHTICFLILYRNLKRMTTSGLCV